MQHKEILCKLNGVIQEQKKVLSDLLNLAALKKAEADFAELRNQKN
jgi:hypothetical protein